MLSDTGQPGPPSKKICLTKSVDCLRKLCSNIGVKGHLAREVLHELDDVHRSLRVQPRGGLIQQEHLQATSSFQTSFDIETDTKGKDTQQNSAGKDSASREPFGYSQVITSGGG